MKKILFVCTALLFVATASKAQVTTSAGIKAQANYSKYRLSGMSGVDSKYGLGAGLGLFAKIEFGEYFAIQPELLFNLHRGKLKSDGTGKLRSFGLEVPVYAVGQIHAGDGKLFVGVGPYVSYGLSSKIKEDGTSVNLYKKHGENSAAMKRFDVGAEAIVGYEFQSGFMVTGGYQLGLKNNLKASRGSMKTSAFNLGVGYKF